MEERNVLIISIVAIICVALVSATVIIIHVNNSPTDSGTDSINASNDTNNTQNTVTTKKTVKKSVENTDPDYDPNRDDSHKYATEDNPVSVEQSDGVYTYYGPGHYDYYAGDNHMSGEYYKARNNEK